MDVGEVLTRAAAWLALTSYVAGESVAAARTSPRPSKLAWWLNTAGCGFFLLHVTGAFHVFYNWSHTVAYADTARQSKELTGWDSGAGIYINYAFTLLWLAEVFWSGLKPGGYSARPRGVTRAVRAFFLFMIVNGAFVFVRGNIRWLGLALCLVLVGAWWLRFKRTIDPRLPSKAS